MSSTSTGADADHHRVIIVDDHPIVRHGLSRLVSRERDLVVCGEAETVQHALELVEIMQPDLVIVDLSLEHDDGLHLIEQIRSMYPKVKMLVSSMHDELIFAPRALRSGAHGYLAKSESVEKIIDAIRQVLLGEVYVSSQLARQLIRQSAVAEPAEVDPTACLSNREFVVFEMIGQGLNTRDISRKLGLSRKTVEAHCKGIKTKLHLRDCGDIRRYAVLWSKDRT